MALYAAYRKYGFGTVLAIFVAAAGAEAVLFAQDETGKPAAAQPNGEIVPQGFDLLDTYRIKRNNLIEFLKEHNLDSAVPKEPRNPAADEAHRLIGGLQILMDQEAKRLFYEAMRSPNPEDRDRILKKLKAGAYSPQVTNWIDQDFKKRTVGGEGGDLFPTVQDARAAEKRLKEQEAEQQRARAEQDMQDLSKLKNRMLTDRLSEAAKEFSEEDAQKLLAAAMRLVLGQRRQLLRNLSAQYPNTKAGREAEAILTRMREQSEWVADRKLASAVQSPAVFDQPWRRMKEIQRDHPRTKAAAEAKRLFAEHAAQVPPVVMTNETGRPLHLTWDVSYGGLQHANIAAGQTESFQTAFPMLVRIQISQDDWRPYQVRPGMHYFLRPGPKQQPILVDEWGIQPGKPIVPPQFGRPLPHAPPLPVWADPHFFCCPCLYGYGPPRMCFYP